MTPLRRALGWSFLTPLRRTLGLLAFSYASLHLAVYLGLEVFFEWGALFEDVTKRLWVTAGFAGFLLMLPLALTSTRSMMKRLGRRWVQLHTLIYPAALCTVLHFLWLTKADRSEPLIYAALTAVLLVIRIGWRRNTSTRLGRQP